MSLGAIIIYNLRSISPAMLEDFKGLSYLNLIPSSDERVICDAQVGSYFDAFLFFKTTFHSAYLLDTAGHYSQYSAFK